MINLLKSLFSSKGNDEIKEQLAAGAIVLDVRSESEYKDGHVANSKNIPLNALASKLAGIKKLNKTVVCVCASGMRSAQAANFLNKSGVKAYNGGSWHSVNKLINQ